MGRIRHNGGLQELVVELGFDVVKYFEGSISGTAATLSIAPPARRLTLRNASQTDAVYLNVNGGIAAPIVSLTPGDNIKINAQCVFSMDFDILTTLSLVTSGASVTVEGILGWKGSSEC